MVTHSQSKSRQMLLKSLATTTFAIASLGQLTSAQLSDSNRQGLYDQAHATLTSSDSLAAMASAVEVLSLLGQTPEGHQRTTACKRTFNMLNELESGSETSGLLPSTVYSKAQVYRYLGCETLGGVTSEIDSILSVADEGVADSWSDSELYWAYMLYQDVGEYKGAKNPPSEKFNDYLAQKAVTDWLVNFKADKWTLKKTVREAINSETQVERVVTQTLSPEMLQMTEMLASLMTRKAMKDEIEKKLGTAFTLLVEQAYPKNGRFFVTKNAAQGQGQTLAVTYQALKAIEKFNHEVSGPAAIGGLNKAALRDYFLTKLVSVGGQDLSQTVNSLKALNDMMRGAEAIPFAKVVAGDNLVYGKDGSVVVQFYDALDNPVGVKGQKLGQVQLQHIVSGKLIDVSPKTTLDDIAGKVTISLETSTQSTDHGSYRVKITFKDSLAELSSVNQVLVSTTVKVSGFTYEVSKNPAASSELMQALQPGSKTPMWTYPQEVKTLEQQKGSDNTYLHFGVQASLSGSSGVIGSPAQVYLAFRKTDSRSSEQLQINAQAEYSEQTNAYSGVVDFSSQFDLVNGKYEVYLVCVDSSAPERVLWDLGQIEVWFKEGQSETNNQRINANYAPKRVIVAEFEPANEKEKNPVFAIVFVLAIAGAFFFYLKEQGGQRANVKKIDFWGMLLVLNVLAIMGVIIAFWISVNLIDTLWTMLFLTPITLFIFNKGLAGSASCDLEKAK